mmetsp:Transcript_33134/g.61104  ORF Transcript_33134/g.61104 Transcript_33134/m.61104 type:complete len:185 (-) Transcript_33134:1343-1897(-)
MHTMHRIGHRVAAVTTCSSSSKFPLQALLCRHSRHNYSSTSSTSGRSHATISLQSTILSRQQHAITPSFSSRHKVATSMTTTTRHLSSQNTKLAHEWIVDGNVVPQSKMEGDGIMNDDGKEVIVFLHGLLGNAKVCDYLLSFFPVLLFFLCWEVATGSRIALRFSAPIIGAITSRSASFSMYSG